MELLIVHSITHQQTASVQYQSAVCSLCITTIVLISSMFSFLLIPDFLTSAITPTRTLEGKDALTVFKLHVVHGYMTEM